uniref:Lysozyme g-like protein 2 n=1 Tax=Bos taurus TaxID=9913 RepID=A0AAA9SX47_BOVIN
MATRSSILAWEIPQTEEPGAVGYEPPPTMLSFALFGGLFVLIGTSRGSHSFTHTMSPRLHFRLYHGCYGDVMIMETPGIPCDNTRMIACGIRGSEMFAEMDLKALQSYQILIKEIGLRHCVDPALIAAIISRESHGGTILLDGWDHTGLKFGLMQLDKKIHHPVGTWDGKEHLLQAVGILTDSIKAIQKKFPSWSVAQHLKGGLSAFKSGTEAIATSADIQADYVNDVLARAKFYKKRGF